MTTWADFAVVAGLLLLPLMGASESKSFFGPDKPWLLPNHIRTPIAFALLALVFSGFYYQDYMRPEAADWHWIDFFGQTGTAFSRVFGMS